MNVLSGLALALASAVFPGQTATTSEAFDSNGIQIRYYSAGEGEPVVLVHGWMSDATMWGRDAKGQPKLSASPGFRIIALDCRGHGQSDKPHDSSKYGVEMAEDVVRLLDHLKIDQAHLIGYSMGAFIVGKVAATHPKRARSLVFGGQAPLIVGRPPSASREVEVFAKAVEDGNGLGPYIIEVSPPDKPKPSLEAANTIAKILYDGKDAKAWAVAGLSLGALEFKADELKRSPIPILFIHGANDLSAVNATAFAREALGRGEVKTIDGGNHITTLAKPDFGKAILEFLSAHRGS